MNQDSIDIIKANQNIEAYQKRIFELETKLKEAEDKLNDCRKTAGSDTDCDPLVAVQELRNDYQSALEEIQVLESQLAASNELVKFYERDKIPMLESRLAEAEKRTVNANAWNLLQENERLVSRLANSWEKQTVDVIEQLIHDGEHSYRAGMKPYQRGASYFASAKLIVQFLDKKKEG